MKAFIYTLLLLAIASTLEGKPANIVNPGAARNSAELRIDSPQGAGHMGVADPSAVAGGNSGRHANQGGAVIHSSSSSSSESRSSGGVQAGGGATGDAGMPDTPDGTDAPDYEIEQDPQGGSPIVAQGGVPFGGAGGGNPGKGGSAKSSTPPPGAGAAPGLIVSEGSSGSAAVAVVCVVGVVAIAAGVGFFIYKRK